MSSAAGFVSCGALLWGEGDIRSSWSAYGKEKGHSMMGGKCFEEVEGRRGNSKGRVTICMDLV